jgi:hypothetical protein
VKNGKRKMKNTTVLAKSAEAGFCHRFTQIEEDKSKVRKVSRFYPVFIGVNLWQNYFFGLKYKLD